MLYIPLPVGKVCRRCKQWQPEANLVRHKQCSLGLNALCKSCHASYYRAKRLVDPEQFLERERRYRENNPEKLKQSRERWQKDNPDHKRTSARLYRSNHRQQRLEYDREYNKKHPESRAMRSHIWRLRNPEVKKAIDHRRAARKRKLLNDFTAADWRRALDYFGGCCAVCGRPPGLWHTIAADHWIPLSSADCPGTIPSNIIPLCHGVAGCNQSKKDRAPSEWLLKKFGKSKGQQILERIQAYLNSLS